MEIIGIVAEFNPFHNGHKHLIDTVKELYNPDVIVAVISSSFVQRGEPAIFDKWTRAEMALDSGVDIVLELPFLFACQNAEIFAKGAVKILSSTGITSLAFGAESENLDDLKRIANVMIMNDELVNGKIKELLSDGNSYIVSRNEALLSSGLLEDSDLQIISKSNNILAIEYLKAIETYNPNLKSIPILRTGVDHDSEEVTENISSATNIRRLIYEGSSVEKYVPIDYKSYLNNSNLPDHEILYSILKFNTLLSDKKDIKNTLEYEIGIENRIVSFLDLAKTIDELSELVSTKRMTRARVRRIIINSLLKVKEHDVRSALSGSSYIRILGMNSVGAEYIRRSSVQKISNYKEIKKKFPNLVNIEKLEVKATNLYSIITHNRMNRDYLEKPIIK